MAHDDEHEAVPGEDATRPAPVPLTETCTGYPNTAEVPRDPIAVAAQTGEEPAAVHAPVQCRNVAPGSGVAVSVRTSPGLARRVHATADPPQEIRFPLTVPPPVGVTVNRAISARFRFVPCRWSRSTAGAMPFTRPRLVYCQKVQSRPDHPAAGTSIPFTPTPQWATHTA